MQKSFLECACKTPRHKRTPRDKRAEPEKNTPPQTYISRKSQIFLRDFFRENSRFFVIFCIFCEITPPQAHDFAKVRFESASSGFPTPMISQNGGTCARFFEKKCKLRATPSKKHVRCVFGPCDQLRSRVVLQKTPHDRKPRGKGTGPDKNAPPQY